MIRWWIWSFTWTRLVEIHCTIITSSIVLERISRRIDGPCGHSRTVVEQQFFVVKIFFPIAIMSLNSSPLALGRLGLQILGSTPPIPDMASTPVLNSCLHYYFRGRLEIRIKPKILRFDVQCKCWYMYQMYFLWINCPSILVVFVYKQYIGKHCNVFFTIHSQLTGSWPVAMRCDSLTAGRPW